ncbi:HNH endonuclease signature motif containing protein [Microbacterium sp. NC79]|uniref:HNH endonuclease signature motif containing protein n=1 Tax=Microbacterium sp. NC79 TaxID=2851009 RepID=UPI0020B83A62|nr:HNH endonuclease signature motif containing protein [Microbacterium sp. NC79]
MTIEQPPDEPIAGSAPDLPPSEATSDGGAMSALPAEAPAVSSEVAATDEMPGGFAFALSSLREIQRARAGLDAMETALYAAVFEHVDALSKQTAEPIAERDMMIRSACAEIAAALRLSDRAVQRRMSDAYDVYVGFPQTFEALRTGAITVRHVQEIVKASDGLPVDMRADYEVAALERALITTPPRLAAVLPSVANQIHARSIAERHQTARKRRAVTVRDVGDGMAELVALLPAVLAHGIHDRLTSIAVAVEKADPDDERCRDEIRADVFADIALSGAPLAHGDGLRAIRANVQVSVPVTTLAGGAGTGAELIGVGPMDADTARTLAGNEPGWDRVMTHPISGAVLAVDRYRPGEDLRRRLRVRDEHCRFPGCRQPAHRCEADHGLAAADGGKTHLDNLALLCKGHHTMKHAAHWQVVHEQHGVLRWTSPNGNTYIDTPTPVLRFYPSEGAASGDGNSAGDRPPGDEPPPHIP